MAIFHCIRYLFGQLQLKDRSSLDERSLNFLLGRLDTELDILRHSHPRIRINCQQEQSGDVLKVQNLSIQEYLDWYHDIKGQSEIEKEAMSGLELGIKEYPDKLPHPVPLLAIFVTKLEQLTLNS